MASRSFQSALQLSQPNHTEPLNGFNLHIRAVLEANTGFNGAGERVPYIPRESLAQYFKYDARISDLLRVLFYPREPPVTAEYVRNNCLTGFCILLYINKGVYVRNFVEEQDLRDDHLPLSPSKTKPPRFPGGDREPDFWDAFRSDQFKFTPAVLEDSIKWSQDKIIPYLAKDNIARGCSADLFHVTLPANSAKWLPKGSTGVRDFALKHFRGQRGLKYHEFECDNYRRINGSYRGSIPGLIRFHCGYKHGEDGYVLLEYADKGSISSFMQENKPPDDGFAILWMYKEILEVLQALVIIHDLSHHGSQRFQGVHQDIHPGNILVVTKEEPGDAGGGQTSTSCTVSFKVADLGLCRFRAVDEDAYFEVPIQDAMAGQVYGPPETFRGSRMAQKDPLKVGPSADIFSLGCVLLVFCTWMVRGYDGILEFEAQRRLENANSQGENLRFHNGDGLNPKILGAVERQIDLLRNNMRRSDFVTGKILSMLWLLMLPCEPGRRASAMVLRGQAEHLLDAAEKELREQNPPSTPVRIETTLIPKRRRVTTPQPTTVDPISEDEKFIESPESIDSDDQEERFAEAHAYPNGSPRSRQPSQVSQTMEGPGTASTSGAAQRNFKPRSVTLPTSGKARSMDYAQIAQSRKSSRRQPSTQTRTATLQSVHYDQPDVEAGASKHIQTQGIAKAPPLAIDTHRESEPPPQTPVHDRTSVGSKVARSSTTSPRNDPPANIKLAEVMAWKRACKTLMGKIKRPPLTGEYHLKKLGKRDQTFLLDNSVSMHGHWNHVENTFEGLSYLVKMSDDDGMDLHFTNYHIAPIQGKKGETDALLKHVSNLRHRHKFGKTDIRTKLSEILEEYGQRLDHAQSVSPQAWTRHVTPKSLYVFTDGLWEGGSDAQSVIIPFLKKLKERNYDREQFGIQFIQFGSDLACTDRLKELDELGKKPEYGLDFIDTEPHTGNVWKMLLGAVDSTFDD